jgi:hypothetical protein
MADSSPPRISGQVAAGVTCPAYWPRLPDASQPRLVPRRAGAFSLLTSKCEVCLASLEGVSTPFMVAGGNDVRHRRESPDRHEFALRGDPFPFSSSVHSVPTSLSLGRIALAGVDAEHLVASGVPELTAAILVVVAVNEGEMPDAACRCPVKWSTLGTWHHANAFV